MPEQSVLPPHVRRRRVFAIFPNRPTRSGRTRGRTESSTRAHAEWVAQISLSAHILNQTILRSGLLLCIPCCSLCPHAAMIA